MYIKSATALSLLFLGTYAYPTPRDNGLSLHQRDELADSDAQPILNDRESEIEPRSPTQGKKYGKKTSSGGFKIHTDHTATHHASDPNPKSFKQAISLTPLSKEDTAERDNKNRPGFEDPNGPQRRSPTQGKKGGKKSSGGFKIHTDHTATHHASDPNPKSFKQAISLTPLSKEDTAERDNKNRPGFEDPNGPQRRSPTQGKKGGKKSSGGFKIHTDHTATHHASDPNPKSFKQAISLTPLSKEDTAERDNKNRPGFEDPNGPQRK